MNHEQRQKLLGRLNNRIDQLAQAVAGQKDFALSTPRFDRQLFQEKGTRLTNYVQEIQRNYQQISQLSAYGQTDRLNWLAERVVMQISALQREMATLSLRPSLTLSRSNGTGEDKYHRIQHTQQRLLKEIAEYEYQLGRVETLVQQQMLQHNIEVLEDQLVRCRKTLSIFSHEQKNSVWLPPGATD